MKKIITLFCLMLSLFAQAQQNGVVEYMYIHRNNGLVDSVAVAEIDSVTFAFQGVPEIPDTPVTPPAEAQYEAVDLGLPSGIKWATCNVGATKPEEYGGYYAWGETEEKENYDWSTYKWCNGDKYSMTKYCRGDYYGTFDNKTTLEPEDDVAHVKWGGSWRMPTEAEQEELCDNCTWTWTTLNGVRGYTVTGPNGNSIFLPAAGSRNGTGLNYSGSYGSYWSSSLHEVYCYDAFSLCFDSSYHNCFSGARYYGHSVRPVCE